MAHITSPLSWIISKQNGKPGGEIYRENVVR